MQELKLATGERIIKTFNYGKSLGAGSASNYSTTKGIIVTNRRLVYQSIGKYTVSRKEIPIKAAEFLSLKYVSQRGSLLGFFLCLLAAAGAAVAAYMTSINYIYIGAGVMAVLAVILLNNYLRSKRGAVALIVSGRTPEHPLIDINMSNLTEKGTNVFEVMVDRQIALAMVNELGAILADVRNNLYP